MKFFLNIIVLLLMTFQVLAVAEEFIPVDITQEEQEIEVLDNKITDESETLNTTEITVNEARTLSLRALNKITARTYDLKAKVGEIVNFGSLEIITKQCRTQEQEDIQEDMALVEINEALNGQEKKRLFYGWIFASSPALSGLEHPVYYITLIKCDY